MSGPFDDLFPSTDPAAQLPTTGGPFDDLFSNTDQSISADINRGLGTAKSAGMQVLGVVGRTLQPFAAPQQLIFGALGSLEDLATGQGSQKAWETLKQGGASALSYATYQHGADLAFVGDQFARPQTKPITGYELFKKAGASDTVARWGGTAADFFLDVPLIGAVGKVAKVDRLTAGLKIGENMAASFASPEALRAFAGGILAAPFTTQPIKRLVEAVPLGVREGIAAKTVDPLLNLRHTPADITQAASPTVGQFFIARNKGLPEEMTAAVDRANSVKSQYAVLSNEALQAFDKAQKGLGMADAQTLKKLTGQLADESNPALRLGLESQIQALEQRTGRAGLYNDAMTATNKGVQFDVFSAEKLHAADLMDSAALREVQSGDKRHLRRLLAFYGENPTAHVQRILERNNPASIAFDEPKMAALYDRVTQQAANVHPQAPNGQQFARDFQAMYTNPKVAPIDALKGYAGSNNLTPEHLSSLISDIGRDWSGNAGIAWRNSDAEIGTALTQKLAEGGAGGAGGAGRKAVTTARLDLSSEYLETLGQIDDFTKRIQEQARVAGKAASVGGLTKDVRSYLVNNNLIERVDVNNAGRVLQGAGTRTVSQDLADRLGQGFQAGDVIPTEAHRILSDTVSVGSDPSSLGTVANLFQWWSSRWQGAKLANPASIITNIRSGFVMADHAGHDIPQLLTGIKDYMTLHRNALKGDGALDTTARVNGVTMHELFNAGDFTHNTLFNNEVVQQTNRLMDGIANPNGNPVQQMAANMTDWLTTTAGGQSVSGAYKTVSSPARWLGDMYSRVDSTMKGGLYMSLRKQGKAPEEAARIADETFFNYNNVPYMVDGLRKLGLMGMPFSSFKFLATGRFFRTLYQNPYGMEKYYRLGNSSQAAQDQSGDQTSYQAAIPDFIKNGLYVPVGKDSQGRVRALKMDDILPESAMWDMANSDNVTAIEPPLFAQWRQIISGKGYQDRPLYNGGGTFQQTYNVNPTEAVRGMVKQLWQFGAYPWAPGQPMTERIVKALADKAIPVDAVQHPVGQMILKSLTEGPAAPWSQGVWTTAKAGSGPQPDIIDALARAGGFKTYPVQTDSSKPGSASGKLMNGDTQIKLLDAMENSDMRSAQTDQQRKEVADRYAKLRAPLIAQQQYVSENTTP